MGIMNETSSKINNAIDGTDAKITDAIPAEGESLVGLIADIKPAKRRGRPKKKSE